MPNPQFSVATGHDAEGRLVLAVAGEIDASEHQRITDALAAITDEAVVLDLRQLGFIDSTGLRAFVLFAQQRHGAGRKTTVWASSAVQRLLELTGLGPLFELEEPPAGA